MSSILRFEKINKVFDSDIFKKKFQALDNVSFDIHENEVIGFLGANGAGKTTSLKILMDFIRPTSGEVIFSEKLGVTKNDIFKNIGFLPERPYFYPHLTGRKFCQFMGHITELDKKTIENQIDKWGKKFKIDFALDREIGKYSKGMMQRIGFLSTLLHDPKLIILDEPLSGLDPIGRKELKDIIVMLKNEGKTVFFSSHIVSDVEQVCSSVIFLKKGKLIYEGSVDDVINKNLKPKVEISYLENDRLCKDTVENSQKDEFLARLINESNRIVSVIPEKPTLEEIFYQVK